MKYRAAYSFYFLTKLPDKVRIPLRIEVDNKRFEIREVDERLQNATGFIEASVNPQELSLRAESKSLDGTTISSRIVLPSTLDFSNTVSQIVHVLSFIMDIPIRYARSLHKDELIPETTEDQMCLESFGTRRIYHETTAISSIRTFDVSDLDLRGDFLNKLIKRETGLALYAQALLQQEASGMFRELWKVLEAAFGLQDKPLIRSLIEYEPAKQLGFSDDELDSLLTLRGRASHAKSSAGIAELEKVNREVKEKLPRLKCLVEQVLLTKKTWGTRSEAIERFASVSAYIGADGNIVIFQRD